MTNAEIECTILDRQAQALDVEVRARAGKYYIAPLHDPDNAHTAGWDGNVFETEAAAHEGIAALEETWPESTGDWIVRRY